MDHYEQAITACLLQNPNMAELYSTNPQEVESTASEILANICTVLDCCQEQVVNVTALKDGLTNFSLRIEVDGTPYVYRVPGAGTDAIISRESEAYSQKIARELGIDRTFIHEDPQTGWKISRYIENCIPFDYHNQDHIEAAMRLGRTLHNSGAKSPFTFDVYAKAVGIVDLLDAADSKDYADFESLAQLAAYLDSCVKADNVPLCLCHNDFYEPNFLVHESGMDLIDWEYSAMSDYASDLGTFICCSDYGIPEAEAAIRTYFQREPTAEEMRHCMAYVGLSAYYWFVWALYKAKTGDPVGEWTDLWHNMANSFGKHAEALYKA